MKEQFDLQNYLISGVQRVVKDALKATARDPKGSAFMLRFAADSTRASKKRLAAEQDGLHVPPFLIASITSACNLHCAGCYSRCNEATVDAEPVTQLSSSEWKRILDEAADLGVSFILLAGGEPLLRKDIIEAAGEVPSIMFPIFTNGSYLGDPYLELFSDCRNLLPIMSIEGDETHTDERRGNGIYAKQMENMAALKERHILFGISVTVTKENLAEVTSDAFLSDMAARGVKAVIYVEYVPVTEETEALAPGEEEREVLRAAMEWIRSEHEELVAISFPGDEKSSGGCLAAGRGFFHINSHGGAEPCPFSPHTAANIKDTTLKEALNAPLFRALRAGDLLAGDHDGGCVLYEKREEVERLVVEQSKAAQESEESTSAVQDEKTHHEEKYLTVGRFSRLGKGYARCCGPTAITNLIMTLKGNAQEADPDAVFLSVARAGTRRGIYMNMDLFKRFGGTSNFLSEPYIKTCLKQQGVNAELHYLGRLTEERLSRAVRRGSYLYLELMFHPRYGNHHVLCYGADRTKDGWLLRIADGWMVKPVYLTIEDLKRTYAIEVLHS